MEIVQWFVEVFLIGALLSIGWIYFSRRRKRRKSPPENHEELEKIFSQADKRIKQEELFLRKNLKVSDLAIELHQTEKSLSSAINQHGGGNFNSYINRYRVEHSKKIIASGEFDHYTIEAIADMAGFTNKVSFYNAFKSNSGMSPSEFRSRKQP